MANNPLDIVSALFSDKSYINNLTYESARQNLFIILRRIAIMYPEQANVFNNAKVNPLDVVKFWSDYLYTGKKPPYWVYTPGAVKNQSKENKSAFTKQDMTDYMSHYKIGRRDFESLMKIFPEETAGDIKLHSDYLKKIKSNKND